MSKPMAAVEIQRQHILAVETDQGWLITRVLRTERVQYQHNFASLAGGAGTDYTVIKDSNNNEILLISKYEKNTIWQVFWGMHSTQIKVFWELPSGSERRGQLENDIGGNSHGVATEAVFGWLLDGRESPAGNPTDVGSFILLPNISVGIALFNPTNEREVVPRVTWYINKLWHNPLDPMKPGDAKLILAVLRAKERAHVYQPGVRPLEYGKWAATYGKLKPVKWDGKRAMVEDSVIGEDGKLIKIEMPAEVM